MNKIGCIILAAGEGTRMKSEIPKMLFTICGKTIIEHILDTVLRLNLDKIYFVVGHKKEQIIEKIKTCLPKTQQSKIIFVTQHKQLGSGDAVLQVKKFVDKKINSLLVLSGDVPLITKNTLLKFIAHHNKTNTESCVLTVEIKNPFSYGRIVRDSLGRFSAIVEEKDATENQRNIKEVNSGIYIFKLPSLWESLKKVKPENQKKEYYLTDVIKYCETKTTFLCENEIEVKGINTRADLSEVEDIVREKLLNNLMLNGVSVYMPKTVYIDYFTRISKETIVYPGSILTKSVIKENCVIGPYSVIENSSVGSNTKIIFSFVSNSKIGKNCNIGPYGRIRPGVNLFNDVSVGNFVELKNSIVKNKSKINHLSYIGDTEIGREVNIGAGVITCNYDGRQKHRTFIGDKSFIGSNANLVAPIKIGNNVVVAAGSTLSKDVKPFTLAIERSVEIHKNKSSTIKNMYGIR